MRREAVHRGHEVDIGRINKERESIVAIADDVMETHCVREECMGTRPT